MQAEDFILFVKAKLNRIDTSFWQDVREEEVLFFGTEALKKLALRFDSGQVPPTLDRATVNNYLAYITDKTTISLTSNKTDLPSLIKLKNVSVKVNIGSKSSWQPAKEVESQGESEREYNPFTLSFPDRPNYMMVGKEIVFFAEGFTCSDIRITYLEQPELIKESDVLDIPFINELQDETVTLILENLESRRLQTQPTITKS